MICQEMKEKTGADSKYVKDCFIRHILDESLPGTPWSRALDSSAAKSLQEIIIEAGIGRLRITPTETDFQPAIRQTTAVPPLPAPDALRESRLAVCQSCDRYNGSKCTIAGCGCAGQGTPSALFSKCPMGLWQPNA